RTAKNSPCPPRQTDRGASAPGVPCSHRCYPNGSLPRSRGGSRGQTRTAPALRRIRLPSNGSPGRWWAWLWQRLAAEECRGTTGAWDFRGKTQEGRLDELVARGGCQGFCLVLMAKGTFPAALSDSTNSGNSASAGYSIQPQSVTVSSLPARADRLKTWGKRRRRVKDPT